MPPRINQGQSSFSVSQESQQVVCPLKNQDGTNCRKRCLGEKRFRSMQEHIRRAHPEHYIAKLPATEESFRLMIDTPPQAKPPQLTAGQSTASSGESTSAANGVPTITTQSFGNQDTHMMDYSQTGPPRTLEDQHPMAATAAVALAQLHNQRAGSEWSQDRVGQGGTTNGHAIDKAQGFGNDFDRRPHSSYELPPIHDQPPFPTSQPRGLLPSMLDHSPPGRSTTLPPIQDGARPRVRSIGEQARITKHQRRLSKGYARRMSMEGRKAYSVEPPGSDAFLAKTKRWEDLIEAATSIRGDESDRDLTPIPGSPQQRSSVPPLHVPSSIHRADIYKASPLARALTPPGINRHPASPSSNVPFPSIESSTNSYPTHAHSHSHSHSHSQNSFPMPSTASSYPSDSSPQFSSRGLVEIYCSNCRRVNPIKDSFACVECIGGFCVDCVYTLSGSPPSSDGRAVRAIGGRAQQPCPKCRDEGGVYKPFQIELRV